MVLLVSGRLAHAEESTHELARFVAGEHSLENLIRFPELEQNVDVTIFCSIQVWRSGELRYNNCFGVQADGKVRAFQDAVSDAARLAKATPATMSGKKVKVRMQYRVKFSGRANDASISVYPNWGVDSDRFGPSYEAPQRRESNYYPEMCARRARVAITVDETGQAASDLSFEAMGGTFGPGGQCERGIERFYDWAEFIPGRHQGQAIESTFVEIWGF